MSTTASSLIFQALTLFEKNKTKFIDQNEKYVTYAKKIKKEESRVKWNETSKKLIAKINGLSPFPGAWFNHNGNRIKILEAELSEFKGKEGEVLTNNLIVGCQDKAIKINLLQKEGKKALDTKSFLAGYQIPEGEVLL